ncbi:MAG: ATP-binding protein [Alphaproteobacteria bacterium]|nr:ATP-binding protein [Alphaproteobacteria bacterium]
MKKKNRPLYLQKLINFKDKEAIKVITGLRRCGKSSILEVFRDYLADNGVKDKNIIYMNFETLANRSKTYMQVYDEIIKKAKLTQDRVYIFLDEIQQIEKWELTVNSLRVDIDCDIYITGSNAYLLSSQLSTYLSGRYIEIKILPLSFKEFVEFNNFAPTMQKDEIFALYLKFGGMPILTEYDFKNEEIVNSVLEGIFTSVIMEDVIKQAPVRDVVTLDKIINFLADNIGNSTSINNIKNVLLSGRNADERKITSATIDNYIKLLENAFIFYPAFRYDIKGKEYLKTQGKYYMVDLGLRNQRLGFRNTDRGYILENVVYFELLRRGYKVSVGKTDEKEIDFIAIKSDEKLYIQVTESLSNESTRQRELAALRSVKDHFEKIVLTTDVLFTGTSEDGIKIVNLTDWLLE